MIGYLKGEPLNDVNFPYHAVSQVTALTWHPERHILASGWENAELKVWTGDKEFQHVATPHLGPITILEFSEKGGRLVSCDTVSLFNFFLLEKHSKNRN